MRVQRRGGRKRIVAPDGSPVTIPDGMLVKTLAQVDGLARLGVGGQGIARKWLDEHPGYLLSRIQCSVANDADRLRHRIETPRA